MIKYENVLKNFKVSDISVQEQSTGGNSKITLHDKLTHEVLHLCKKLIMHKTNL